MKALSVVQPWATLLASGAKRFETRAWHTTYRGWVAIHAGKSRDFARFQMLEPFRSSLGFEDNPRRELPHGAIVGVGKLARVVECGALHSSEPVDYPESEFGNFAAGRFAWDFRPMFQLVHPIPHRGMQGLWDVPPPIVATIRSAVPQRGGFLLNQATDGA